MTGTQDSGGKYHCGTLAYTKMGLFALFGWLLWGDFVYNLMETVVPTVLPLKLKALGASNTLMSVIMTSLPAVLNITICPWVSFKSDRHRGKWGRRIPFILSTMPFLTISLIMLGWSESLTPFLQGTLAPLRNVAPATVTIGVITFFLIVFQFFNMFVASVFWYLFNDVVPPQLLGRFMGLFRVVGTLAGMLYSGYIFPHAETHMREILTGGALLYFFGFGLVCLFVKEGQYPPPPHVEGPQGLRKSLKAFGNQSFRTKFYWYFYLSNALASMAGAWAFANVFFNKQMGLTLQDMGNWGFWAGIPALVATYVVAVFVDRWHPLRISAYYGVLSIFTGFGAWVWVFVTVPGELFYWLGLLGGFAGLFGGSLLGACDTVIFMRLMPKSLYGQFCSANAVIRATARFVGGMTGGLALDCIRWLYHGSDAHYRWVFLWPWVVGSLSGVCLILGYREWKRLGGDDEYRPPAPWLPGGFEEVKDKVHSVPPKPRAVMLSMWLGVVGAALSGVMVLIFMHFMRTHHLDAAHDWYLKAFLPLKVLLVVAACVQLRQVKRDIAAHERREKTRFGMPHHGVLLVNAIQAFLYFPIFWYQMISVIKLNMEWALIIFGFSSLLITATGIIGIQVIRWMENEPIRIPAHVNLAPAAPPAVVGTANGS